MPRARWIPLLCALLCACSTQPPAPSRVGEIVTLAKDVHLLPDRFEPGSQPDGNSLLLEGTDGIIVFDTGRHVEHSAALIAWARRQGRPIVAIINSHWHLDHLGGNAPLRRAYPKLQAYASAAVNRALTTRLQRSEARLRARIDDPATDEATRRMLRIELDIVVQRDALMSDHFLDGPPHEMAVGGRALQIGVEVGAVSGGDAWVLDRASGILAVGDFVTLPVPFLDTACAPGWRAAMGRIESLPFERMVPGHGPVMSREDFRRYRMAFERLLDCADGDQPVSACSAGWIADLGPLLPPSAQAEAREMIDDYFTEHLRAAPAKRDLYCQAP